MTGLHINVGRSPIVRTGSVPGGQETKILPTIHQLVQRIPLNKMSKRCDYVPYSHLNPGWPAVASQKETAICPIFLTSFIILQTGNC